MERAAILIDGGYLDKVRLAFNKPVLDIGYILCRSKGAKAAGKPQNITPC